MSNNNVRKGSAGYTALAVLLTLLSIVAPVALTLALAVKTYNLLPAYTFWHFIGTAIAAVLMIVFLLVTLIVCRKSSKSSVFAQTAKVVFTYVCLTTIFGMIVSYILPDIAAKYTSKTLFAEDLYYNGEQQAETNAKLERDFVGYNLLNGNLNEVTATEVTKDYSYKALSAKEGEAYKVEAINEAYNKYLDTAEFNAAVEKLKGEKYELELYSFIYESYVLNDYEYAFNNSMPRRALTMAMTEYLWSTYKKYIDDGVGGNARLKALFNNQYDSFNHDGYNTFDDSLLIYAQAEGRMTVPVIVRLILNEGWTYTQKNGEVYNKDGNFLYLVYDPEMVEAFKATATEGEGLFNLVDDKFIGPDGATMTVKYAHNEDGWIIYENGYVMRPVNWLVLDMLGTPMDLTSIKLDGVILETLNLILPSAGDLLNAAGGLVQEDLVALVRKVANDAALNIGICINDNNEVAISIQPMNVQYGMLGYMQASYVQSNNLLMALINVFGLRNWLFLCGGIGAFLLILAGMLRVVGKRRREGAAEEVEEVAAPVAAPAAPAAYAAPVAHPTAPAQKDYTSLHAPIPHK